jgi:hypothetical protein
MTQTTRGGCLCGAVTFEISGAFDSFYLCHCARCRKDTGSAHAANLFSSTATVAWMTGRANVKAYCMPDTRHERSFCVECGSALPTVRANGALLVVPAGSLDSAPGIPPTAHIRLADRASWDADLDGAPKLDGLPG